ncbi:hypothetical protein M758_10G157800 [Ceratodon purpureus]|nr:hypothetical protein M758_10G157800 [Ceratodon purpureus]
MGDELDVALADRPEFKSRMIDWRGCLMSQLRSSCLDSTEILSIARRRGRCIWGSEELESLN